LDEVVVDRREGLHLPVCDPMEAVVAQGQLSVAAFDAGAGPLEDTSAFVSDLPEGVSFFLFHLSKGSIPGQKRGKEKLGSALKSVPLLGVFGLF
jgi:hypothetical protein